jgi:hypothetical protein
MYHQVGMDVDFTLPLIADLTGIIDLSSTYRAYDDNAVDGDPTRNDLELAAGIRILWPEFLHTKLTAIGSYKYERNLSNNSGYSYGNHIIGADLAWAF